MTTARAILEGSLGFHLNRLSPGETMDADLARTALTALNFVVDEWNGQKTFLFREILSQSSPITGPSAQLGVAWPALASGDSIEGATVQYSGGMDIYLAPIDMGQYANISLKATASLPQYWAHDGAATVYFYPACAGQTVTLRTKQSVTDFADLDTDYSMPKGYKAALSALVSEKLAPSLLGGITPAIAKAAAAARLRIGSQAVDPAIIGQAQPRGNILTNWR